MSTEYEDKSDLEVVVEDIEKRLEAPFSQIRSLRVGVQEEVSEQEEQEQRNIRKAYDEGVQLVEKAITERRLVMLQDLRIAPGGSEQRAANVLMVNDTDERERNVQEIVEGLVRDSAASIGGFDVAVEKGETVLALRMLEMAPEKTAFDGERLERVTKLVEGITGERFDSAVQMLYEKKISLRSVTESASQPIGGDRLMDELETVADSRGIRSLEGGDKLAEAAVATRRMVGAGAWVLEVGKNESKIEWGRTSSCEEAVASDFGKANPDFKLNISAISPDSLVRDLTRGLRESMSYGDENLTSYMRQVLVGALSEAVENGYQLTSLSLALACTELGVDKESLSNPDLLQSKEARALVANIISKGDSVYTKVNNALVDYSSGSLRQKTEELPPVLTRKGGETPPEKVVEATPAGGDGVLDRGNEVADEGPLVDASPEVTAPEKLVNILNDEGRERIIKEMDQSFYAVDGKGEYRVPLEQQGNWDKKQKEIRMRIVEGANEIISRAKRKKRGFLGIGGEEYIYWEGSQEEDMRKQLAKLETDKTLAETRDSLSEIMIEIYILRRVLGKTPTGTGQTK